MSRGARRLRAADVVLLGLVGLAGRRLRACLSALGIAIGIAALVAVVGISSSSRADVLSELDDLGTNLLTLTPGQSFLGEERALPVTAERMIRRIGPVQEAGAVVVVDGTVRRTDLVPEIETGGITIAAADVSLLATVRGRLARGRFLDAGTERLPAVVLGASAAETLGVGRVGVRIWLAERWFSVVGILEPLALAPELDNAALIGRPVARLSLGAGRSASTIYVRAHPDRVVAVRDVLARTASPAHPEEVDVTRPSDALAARATVDRALASLLVGLGALALVVGGIGVANVMVISVLERRGEIGLRRALGATRHHIRLQFLMESLALSAGGGCAGIAVGLAVVAGYARARGWGVALPIEILPAALAAAIAIGAVAGIYPATRASRMAPVEALRSV